MVLSAVRPARLIAYAWGEDYLDDLLSIALPAALAPGNLPHVVSLVPCEVVLLIEEKFKSRADMHPTIQRIRKLCPVHLVGLDDLVHTKDKYGVTLTYALHRGLSDLGSAVTESYLFFINADFVMAENSLRAVLSSLMDGKRLVAAPSYCVNHGNVAPVLRPRITPATGALAIAHRELAGLALDNLHNTIRGKTLNQQIFHLKQMDQFYWLVDDDTLLGHQMPIAIVGMRPERHVVEPNSFWDHGLISEFCPSEKPHVLGDSDDFLMIELREKEVAREQIAPGPVNARVAGEHMVGWVTPYQRSFAAYQLTLHSKELPPSVAVERAALAARMGAILSHCPAFLPSHRDHPQWGYHLGPFMAARHKYLSERLGPRTETERPPANSLPVDRVWWRRDGAVKRFQRKKAEIERIRDQHMDLLNAEIEESAEARRKEINKRFVPEFAAALDKQRMDDQRDLFSDSRSALSAGPEWLPDSRRKVQAEILKKYLEQFAVAQGETEAKIVELVKVRDAADRCYTQEVDALGERMARECAPLEAEYARLTYAHVTSAVVPRVRVRTARDGQISRQAPAGIVAWLRYRLHRGPLQRIRQLAGAAGGAGTVLVVANGSGWAEREASRFPGICAFVTMSDLLTGNLANAIVSTIKFDLCLCELGPEQLSSFDQLVNAVRLCLKPEARILGLYWQKQFIPQSLRDLRAAGAQIEIFIDQFPLTMLLLAPLLYAPTPRVTKKLIRGTWRRSGRTAGSLFSKIWKRVYVPISADNQRNASEFGTVVTIEAQPVPAAQADFDRTDCQDASQDAA